MNYPLLFTGASLLAGFLSIALLIGTLRSSYTRYRFVACPLFASLSFYCFGYALELQDYPIEITLRIIGIEYIGITLSPVFLLVFILYLYGAEFEQLRRYFLYLLIIPVVTLAIVWTDLVIPVLYRDAWMDQKSAFHGFAMEPGIWWYVITIWNIGILIFCLILLLRKLRRPGVVHRRITILILIGIIAPFLGIFLDMYIRTFIPVDITPITLVITGLAIYPAITRYDMMNIVPVAYANIFRTVGSGMIILDTKGRIRDMNPAAEDIFQVTRNDTIERELITIMPQGFILPDLSLQPEDRRKEIELSVHGKPEYYLLDLIHFEDNHVPAGMVLMVTCISDQKKKEMQLFEYNVIIEKRNQEIEAAFQEKEILLKEIHHRVKNNMQVITSLLSLQSRNIKEPEALAMFQITQARIRALGLVHEQLYQSRDLNRINYQAYLKRITSYFLQLYEFPGRVVRCNIDAKDIEIPIDIAVPISLIIAEMMTNSLKYAFIDRDEGMISIQFISEPEKGRYVVDYRDDGSGFNQERSSSDTQGIGTSLITGLAKQLSGVVQREVTADGVHYTITFPIESGSSDFTPE